MFRRRARRESKQAKLEPEPQEESKRNNPDYSAATETHQALSAWFLGPKGENHEVLKIHLTKMLDRIVRARNEFYPNDPTFITSSIQSSASYKREMTDLDNYLTCITELLSHYSLPYFSPRYAGHMCFDNSLPATLGYLAAMLHNPNNVAVEASPLTSYVEYCVGQQLCKMIGYRTDERDSAGEQGKQHKAWGHVTCDGSVANLESMWVARNMKYYPLSVKWAIEEGGLAFVASSFTIPLTHKNAGEVLFMKAFTKDLLNLKPEVILDIPNRLAKQFGISQDFIDREVGKYLIQTIGRDPLERRYGIVKTPKLLVSKMNHYSWPKGAAILGIGRDHVQEIEVDANARMDITQLESELHALTRAGHPIYAVVAIMGTTEHGAVDPLSDILELRREFQDEHGVSFLLHCDAAWGGYFASILHPAPPSSKGARRASDHISLVPEQALSPYTETQLRAMSYADSVTLDPHKSGYVPYPAGGLCYRDERAKYLITWTGPYIDGGAGDVESIGVYGLEGSKPGAAPVAVYVSNEVIGLHRGGYGGLLGEAMFTSVKMYSQWVTIGLESETLIVTPFNMLPAEREGKPEAEVKAQRRFIKERIASKSNEEIVQDAEAMALVKLMGSDLAINAFACNFRLEAGGVPNTDVAEASYLNARIIARLTVTRVDDEARKKPVLLMGTELQAERYGKCLEKFKERLGLDKTDVGPLAALCNVSMSPFPTIGNFVRELASDFKRIAEEEIQNCWKRMRAAPVIHSFVMQGQSQLYLTYLPMFNVGSYRQQLIVTAELPPDMMDTYIRAQKASPRAVFTLHTSKKELLSSILERGSCTVDVQEDLPTLHGLSAIKGGFFQARVELTNITIVKHTSLAPRHRAREYLTFMPFFLYGTGTEQHLDHVLLKHPNIQLSASCVQLNFSPRAPRVDLQKGVIAILEDHREHAMHPFVRSHQADFFAPGTSHRVAIYDDPFQGQHGQTAVDIHEFTARLEQAKPLARGTLVLGDSVFADYTHLNRATVPTLCLTPRERLTRDELLLSVTEDYAQITADLQRVASHRDAQTASDIDEHIVTRAALSQAASGRYSLRRVEGPACEGHTAAGGKRATRTAKAAERSEQESVVYVSRFTMRGPSDEHSREMAVRMGWRETFHQALEANAAQSANGDRVVGV